ncbi:hypothetical protein [Bacillus sp. BP-3]|uniref:hypothetical protein n=1 Tax=Bacillus sp. BP-3 TaxID=3022773 RepID=UPI002330ADDD|nr:hypothetical protein [Bacillus sp. BP-3]MDC2863708.1 hypothetical protein [Bacillus sp. BP-3]
MITLGKFSISYAISLLTFIIGWLLMPYVFDPVSFHQNDLDLPTIFGFIIILIIYGSILDLVACLIGEVLYRNIKQCREFRFGIPVFIGLAVIYILILFLLKNPYSSSLVTPIIMGSLAFYLVRRKI